MTPEQVTIVILNWNRRDDTLACLDCLAKADLGGASILVVDNGSDDGSVEVIRERFPAVRTISLPENHGFAGGNNAGIRAALDSGAHGVLLLNNDTCVSPDFLPPLLWAFDACPNAAAVCSAIHRMDRPEMLDAAYAEVRFDQRHAVQLRGVNCLPGHGFDSRREVEVAVGCSLLLKTDALRSVGLFDETFFAYHEDVDWCLRARSMGYQIFFEPCSRVFHHRSTTTRPLHEAPSADRGKLSLPDLPNVEPLPWNPIRAYLGSRNLVRLLRNHATRVQQQAFLRSCLAELPLEIFAVIKNREGWLRLDRWGYRDFFRQHFIERHPVLLRERRGFPGKIEKALLMLVLVPVDVFWALPREWRAAQRAGRTAEFTAYLRGLWDGLLDRPLPLKRLGLRRR